jgi:hypothetical protein
MGDEDDEDLEPAAGPPPLFPRLPTLDPVDEEAAALARHAMVAERFGAFVGRTEAASRRRHVLGLAAAVLGTVLILAGYPIYRSAERTLGVEDVRRTPPPPGWPKPAAVTPQRPSSTAPLMTRGEPLAPPLMPPLPQATAVPATEVEAAPLQPTPVQAGSAERAGAAVPPRALTGMPLQRTARNPQRTNSPAARGADAGGAAPTGLASHGEKSQRMARVHRSARHRTTAPPLFLTPATSREIAALASGR